MDFEQATENFFSEIRQSALSRDEAEQQRLEEARKLLEDAATKRADAAQKEVERRHRQREERRNAQEYALIIMSSLPRLSSACERAGLPFEEHSYIDNSTGSSIKQPSYVLEPRKGVLGRLGLTKLVSTQGSDQPEVQTIELCKISGTVKQYVDRVRIPGGFDRGETPGWNPGITVDRCGYEWSTHRYISREGTLLASPGGKEPEESFKIPTPTFVTPTSFTSIREVEDLKKAIISFTVTNRLEEYLT